MRKVFLDDLPRRTGYKSNPISWKNSVGYKVRFIYDDIEGEIEIIDYDRDKLRLTVVYNGDIFNIHTGNFVECKLSIILRTYKVDYLYNIGDRIIDEKRDLVIIDRKRSERKNNRASRRVYRYRCNKCGFECGKYYKKGECKEELWISEYDIIKGNGCSCCSRNSSTIVEGINDVPTTASWMVKYFQGGYDEAKMYSKGSVRKVQFSCPDCGNKKTKSVNEMYRDKTLGCTCGDGFSYPEKFLFSLLNQLNVNFETQLSKTTFRWCDKYRYDFYLPEYNMIIETHGLQHYEEAGKRYKGLNEQQENDKIKKNIALDNGVENYIELDCRHSEMDWIKKSVLNSKLKNILDLSKVDFEKADLYAITSNKVREVCDYWNNKEEWETTNTIAKNNKWGITANITIINYLKRGCKIRLDKL
nr:MAG TPA: restriction enzyme [Caudoviricetes sp.]